MKEAIYETYFISSKLKLTNVNANLEKKKLREQILKASNQVKEFLNTCLLRGDLTTERSRIFKQTYSCKLEVCLSMYGWPFSEFQALSG